MAKENKTVKSSTKEEAVMYLLLMIGVAAIVSLFAVNVILIDQIMGNTITENYLLRDNLKQKNESNPSEDRLMTDDFVEDSVYEFDQDEELLKVLEEELTQEELDNLTEDLSGLDE